MKMYLQRHNHSISAISWTATSSQFFTGLHLRYTRTEQWTQPRPTYLTIAVFVALCLHFKHFTQLHWFSDLHTLRMCVKYSHCVHQPTVLLHNKIISASSAVCWENCKIRSVPLLSQTENTPKDWVSPPFPAPRATSQPILWGHGDKYWHAACETGWVDMYHVV